MQISLLADAVSREFPAALLINNSFYYILSISEPFLFSLLFFFPFFFSFFSNLKEHCHQSLLGHLSFQCINLPSSSAGHQHNLGVTSVPFSIWTLHLFAPSIAERPQEEMPGMGRKHILLVAGWAWRFLYAP